jgi:hydroxymethylpyrimidine/phosphomethylpyrimidine kinase
MTPRSVLVIAGLDPSGGAGILADARVIERHGLRAVGVVTALTEQTSEGVRAVHPVEPEVLGAQLTALLGDVEVAAVKIGMLATEPITRAVADALAMTAAPVVWDPIVRPTRGYVALYAGDPGEALAELAPHLAVVTPNLAEAALLAGRPVADLDAMRAAAAALAARAGACLVTGGHLAGDPIDVLASSAGVVEIAGPRIGAGEVHGTGCALASALACQLALGAALEPAARAATGFVRARLAAPITAGRAMPSVV